MNWNTPALVALVIDEPHLLFNGVAGDAKILLRSVLKTPLGLLCGAVEWP